MRSGLRWLSCSFAFSFFSDLSEVFRNPVANQLERFVVNEARAERRHLRGREARAHAVGERARFALSGRDAGAGVHREAGNRWYEGLVLGYLALGEPVGVRTVAGMGCVLLSVLVITTMRKPRAVA